MAHATHTKCQECNETPAIRFNRTTGQEKYNPPLEDETPRELNRVLCKFITAV